MLYELAVIMPVYNEEGCIAPVINSWYMMLSNLKIDFIMIVLNDGSQDNTLEILFSLAYKKGVKIVNKPNSGHGSTILLGYHQATQIAQWVFQCDSDDELKAEDFPNLWLNRQKYVALFGQRQGHDSSLNRKFISSVSRIIVGLLFGKAVIDVNVPYRLIRSDILKPIIEQIPFNTLAPNVIISASLAKSGFAINNIPISYQYRQTGKVSIVKWRLWKLAILAGWQTLRYRLNFKKT
jgi:glycosyltransferase involved in cell wall biosynthesis